MRWKITLLLAATQCMSFFHRSLIPLVAEPIKLEYAVSDTAIGILIGTAFSLSYIVAAFPLGYLADHLDRFRLLGTCAAIWSTLTSASGLATGFAWLVVCRIGIAGTMAGVTPSAGSIIAHLFTRQQMAKPLGIYAGGIHLGVGMAMLVVAILAQYYDPFAMREFGPLGKTSGWKIILLLAGFPGIILACFLLSLRDLSRPTGFSPGKIGLAGFVPESGKKRATYFALVLSVALLILVSNAVSAWLPSLFIRKFGWGPQDFGFWFAFIVVTAGFLGASGSGYAVALVSRITSSDPRLVVLLAAAILSLPVSIALPLAASPHFCLALYFVKVIFGGATIAMGYSLILDIAPTNQHGRVVAVAGVAFNIVGGALGPLSVALTTDLFFSDPAALPQSIAIVCAVASGLSVSLLLMIQLPRAELSAE